MAFENGLTGQIPDSMASMTSLSDIELHDNLLSGTLPPWMGTLTGLYRLFVEVNQLTGPVPCFNATTEYIRMYLSNNLLTGSLTDGCLPAQIDELSVESNYLTGTIPPSISSTRATQILASDNMFTGTIPRELSNMTSLQTLLLQFNMLEGQPDAFINTSRQIQLSTIDLSFNEFSGTIPSLVFQLPILQSFAAIESCFTGSLPSSICDAGSLEVLLLDGVTSGKNCRYYFNANVFTHSDAYVSTVGAVAGGIPGCVWSLRNLKVLLNIDSPEVRGWAPAVQQAAQHAVNAAIRVLSDTSGVKGLDDGR